MKTSIFLLFLFVLFLNRVEVASLVLHTSRSIDRSINRSGAMIAPYALTTKSVLELFSPVTSSDEDISIFKKKTVSNVSLHFVPSLQSAVCILYRVYYCTYQLARRPLRHGIICEKSGKRASQTQKAVSKQKHNCAKHFG